MFDRVYLASSSADIELAEFWIAKLRSAGLTIAHDWTVDVRNVGDANPREATREQRLGWVSQDIDAVRYCNLFWLLYPTKPTSGAWVELGIAYSTSYAKNIVVSGDWRASIFTSIADHVFDTHEQAFEWIVGARKDSAR